MAKLSTHWPRRSHIDRKENGKAFKTSLTAKRVNGRETVGGMTVQ